MEGVEKDDSKTDSGRHRDQRRKTMMDYATSDPRDAHLAPEKR